MATAVQHFMQAMQIAVFAAVAVVGFFANFAVMVNVSAVPGIVMCLSRINNSKVQELGQDQCRYDDYGWETLH